MRPFPRALFFLFHLAADNAAVARSRVARPVQLEQTQIKVYLGRGRRNKLCIRPIIGAGFDSTPESREEQSLDESSELCS